MTGTTVELFTMNARAERNSNEICIKKTTIKGAFYMWDKFFKKSLQELNFGFSDIEVLI